MKFPHERFASRMNAAFREMANVVNNAINGYNYGHMPEDATEDLVGLMEADRLPDYQRSDRPLATYGWKVGSGAISKLHEEYLRDGAEAVDEWAAAALTATMPRNMPSDGSKGQWRTAHRHKVNAIEWVLGEEYCEHLIEQAQEEGR